MSNRRMNQNSTEISNIQNRQSLRNNGVVDESIATKGIYNNPRIMHTTTCMVGCNVNLILKNGEIYEGIFSTISPELDICLEYAKRLDVQIKNPDAHCITLVFSNKDIVCVEAINIDMNYAIAGDGFTDSAISKTSGQTSGQERELQPWHGDVDDDTLENSVSIDELATSKKNGWDANEMFNTNSKKFNVKSDYNPDMLQYTTKLEKADTPEFRAREMTADMHARSIEQNDSYVRNIARENGHKDSVGDEEARYSSVARSNIDPKKYVPPQKRKSNGQSHKSSDSRSRSDEPSSTPNRVDTPLSPVVVVEESPKEVVQTDFSGDPPTLLPEQNNSPLVRVAKMKELKNFKDNFKLSGAQKKVEPTSSSSTPSLAASAPVQTPPACQLGNAADGVDYNKPPVSSATVSVANSTPKTPSPVEDPPVPSKLSQSDTSESISLASDSTDVRLNINAKVFVPEFATPKSVSSQGTVSATPPLHQQAPPSQQLHQQPQVLMQRMQSSPHQLHMAQRPHGNRPLIQYYGRGVDSSNMSYMQIPNMQPQQAMNNQVRQSQMKRVMVSAASATGQPLMATSGPSGQSNNGLPSQQGPPTNPQQAQQAAPPNNNMPNALPQQPPHAGPSPVQQDTSHTMPVQAAASQAASNQIPQMANQSMSMMQNPIIPPPNTSIPPHPYQYFQPAPHIMMPRCYTPILNGGQQMIVPSPEMYLSAQQPQQVPPPPNNNGPNIPSQTPTPGTNQNQMNNGQIAYQHQMSGNIAPTPTSPQTLYPHYGQNNFLIANTQANMMPQIGQQISMMQLHGYPQVPPPPPPQQQGATPPIMPPYNVQQMFHVPGMAQQPPQPTQQ